MQFGVHVLRSMLVVAAVTLALAALLLGCGREPGEREFDEGLRQLKRGNHARAKVLFEKSITKRPASADNALALNYLGIVSTQLGQLDRAIDEFEESRHRDATLFEPTYNLGVLMYRGGNADRAQSLLAEAASVDLNDARALEFLGHIHLTQQEWPAARRVLYQALERAPNSPAVLTAIASAVLHLEGADVAVSHLMRALESDPDYPPALFNLAVVNEQELRNPDKAAAFFRKYLDVAPAAAQAGYARNAYERLMASSSVPPQEPEITEVPDVPPDADRPGVVKGADGKKKEESLRALLKQARTAADHEDTEQALTLCLKAADIAKGRGDEKSREIALKAAVHLCPDEARAHYAWADCLAEKGEHAAALESFKRALVLSPTSTDAHKGLAAAAVETGELDAALVALKRAVRIAPHDVESLWALAILYDQNLGIPEQAAKSYREFGRRFPADPRIVKARERLNVLEPPSETEPEQRAAPDATIAWPDDLGEREEDAGAHSFVRRLQIHKPLLRNTRAAVQAYNRGTIYQEREDWDRAIYYYTRAIENDNTFPNAYYNLGTVYRVTRDLDLAKDAYLYALELRSDLISARYNLALVYIDLKRYTAAAEQLRTVLEAQPSYAPAHYALGLMYSKNDQTINRARQHYQRFLELSPSDPAARTVREWLREN